MRTNAFFAVLLAFVLAAAISSLYAVEDARNSIPSGAKVFIAPMDDGFDQFLKAAIDKKKVPVVIVDDKSKADFEITGHSETQKASTAKKLILGDWHSNEQASIQINNLKTGEVAWAYSANKQSSAHGKKSTAEACAKHLKEKIESAK
jgi:hypothetical protein